MPRFNEGFWQRIKYCSVCGHELPAYVRVCDRCGSIQRPVGGDGQPVPPDDEGICATCGKEIEGGGTQCEECAATEREETARKVNIRRSNLVAGAVGTASVAGMGVSIWALIAFHAGTGLFGLALGASGLLCFAAGRTLVRNHLKLKNQEPYVWPKPDLTPKQEKEKENAGEGQR